MTVLMDRLFVSIPISSTEATGLSPPQTLNSGPFINLISDLYWLGTEYGANTDLAWQIALNGRTLPPNNKTGNCYAIAVMDGDRVLLTEVTK